MVKGIFMPKLSSTMSVGTLLQWYKDIGDSVEVGDLLFEIMTDKINIEVESYEDGILLAKYYEVDDQIPVNEIIGYIGQKGEKIPLKEEVLIQSSETAEEGSAAQPEAVQKEPALEQGTESSVGKFRATPAARKTARDEKIDLYRIQGTGPKGRIQKADVEQVARTPKVSPLAQKIADDLGVATQSIQGSGHDNKVMKRDILAASMSQPLGEVKTEKLTGMRKIIAQRMSQSAFTVPHVTVITEVDMTQIKKLRESILPQVEQQTGFRISYTDILVKFVSKALQKHPKINATLTEDEVTYYTDTNIGIAVALEDGLVVPVIHQANALGLLDITVKTKDIGNRAKRNLLTIDDFTGSTFTISNLGGYEIDTFTPIINSPEVAILGVGRMKNQPVVIGQSIEIRPMMGLSLSFDHRVIDGAPAAAFLTDLKKLIENPFELLL